MTEAQKWQRQVAMAKSGGFCEICGKPLTNPQGAHRIANTKAHREKFGSFIIDAVDNIAMVCSLKCNDACNIGNNPGACMRLIKTIVDKEVKKYV